MKFEITNTEKDEFLNKIEYQWTLIANNGVFLSESRFYCRKSDCLRAIKKQFGVHFSKCSASKEIIAVRRDKKFATIIDKTK